MGINQINWLYLAAYGLVHLPSGADKTLSPTRAIAGKTHRVTSGRSEVGCL